MREVSLSINEDNIIKIIQFLIKNKKLLNMYVESLPDIIFIRELEKAGLSKDDILSYIVFSAINDWKLMGLRGGAETLWRVIKEEFLRGFSSFEELAERAVGRLKGLWRSRKEQIVIMGRFFDKYYKNIKFLNFIENNMIKLYKIKNMLEELSRESGIRLPVDKATSLIGRSLHLYTSLPVYEETHIMYDVHVAKVSLRLGKIKIKIDKSDILLFSLFNRKLKSIVTEAWDKVAKMTGLSPWLIDALVWNIGRKHCLFDDEVGYFKKSTPCPEARKTAGETQCPFRALCRSHNSPYPPVVSIFSTRAAGKEVVTIINL